MNLLIVMDYSSGLEAFQEFRREDKQHFGAKRYFNAIREFTKTLRISLF